MEPSILPLSHLSPADRLLYGFLLRLDYAPFEISDWEAQFLEDLITNPRPLTSVQRRMGEVLRTKYEGRL